MVSYETEVGADPASKFRVGGDFSKIWWTSIITGSLLQER